MSSYNISYTLLSAYKSCNKKCFLQYIKKVIEPDKVNQRPFIVGTCADWLFGKWVEEGYVPGWMECKADSIFDWFSTKRKIVYRDVDDKEKMKAKLRRAVHDLEVCADDMSLWSKKFESQRKVIFDRDGFSFFAKLDMWFPEELEIWDLKITENKKYLDSFQLYFFAWMIETSLGVKVNALKFFSPLMHPYMKEVEWTDVERHKLETDLYGLLESLKNEVSWNKTSKDCWGCPVQTWCEMDAGNEEDAICEKTASGTISFSLKDTKDEDANSKTKL